MKHFWKAHGLNTGLTLLAVMLAMTGMFFLLEKQTTAQILGPECGVDNGAFLTGAPGAHGGNVLCTVGSPSWSDQTGADGTRNRTCTDSFTVSCVAYRIRTGQIGGGNTTSGTILSIVGTIVNVTGAELSGLLIVSGVNAITVTSGVRDGTFLPPMTTTGDNAATGGEQGITTGITPLLTIQAGSTGASLQSNGGYFTLEFAVTGGYIGQLLRLYRSENGSTRIVNTPDDTCTLSSTLMCRFRTNHLSYFTVGSGAGSITRNNMNYIDQNFWNAGPLNTEVIAALYGTGGGQTAYTQNRSGRNGSQCALTGMAVLYVGPGSGTIPLTLSNNTIYILTGGNYITSGTINIGLCSAIIAQTGSYLYSTVSLSAGMIRGSSDQYAILENLYINGTGGGVVPSHSQNTYGIFFITSVSNNTLHNIQVYNNFNGIALVNDCDSNMLNNVQTHNNTTYGILLDSASNNTLNNIQTYNNASFGIRLNDQANNNAFNNIQAYNNTTYGIGIENNSKSNIFNNTQIYNNSYGIKLITNAYNNILNNMQTYNNSYGINLDSTSTGNKYYGNMKLVGNAIDIDGSGELLTAGIASDLTGLSVTAGTLTTGATLARGYLTNPHDANGYLLTRTNLFSNLRGQFTGRLGTTPITYSIGGYTPLQVQPIKRNAGNTGFEYYGLSGTNLSTGGADRYPAQYIGSEVIALTGNMTLISTYTIVNGQRYATTGNLTVNILSTGADYILSGNFTGGTRMGTFTAGTNISTGFTTTSDGLKVVILQLGTGNTWATHYGFNVIVDTTVPTFTGLKANGTSFTSGQYLDTTGVQFTYSDANFSGATVNGSAYTGLRISTDGIYTFLVTDYAGNSTGITFIIDSTYPTFAGVTNESVTITGGNNTYTTTQITLSRSDTNISGATITGATTFSSAANGSKILTGEGGYTLTVTDKAGHSTGISFSILIPLSGTVNYTGTMVYKAASGVRFTNSLAQLLFQSNKNSTMTVTGDFSSPTQPYTESLTANTTVQRNFTLTSGDGVKRIYTKFTGTTQQTSALNAVYLDTTGPVITNTYPNNGQTGISGDILFGRNGLDEGVGISGYYYYVSNTGTFATYVTSGFTTSASVSVASYKFLYSGTYYRNIVGKDKVGNRGATGATWSFDYIATVDSDPDTFTFDSITDAETDTAYMSNTVTIAGLTLNAEVPVSIDNGVLYISGIVVGRTGTVKQGDTIKIELISSSEVDRTVTSTLTIGSQTIKFRVTTSTEGTETTTLSSTTKLNIITVFDTIADLYEDNKGKQVEFMVTFKSMLNDLIDEMEDDSLNSSEKRKLAILKYLLDLTEQFIDDENISDGDIHTAPNGKRYIITYDSAKACYTSPNFLTPNKCFPSLDVMKSYINSNNLARTHTVDTARTTPSYMAPNGKTYTILKTTDGRYFSYRFISPKYFNSLQAAKDYIKKNNPKGKGR